MNMKEATKHEARLVRLADDVFKRAKEECVPSTELTARIVNDIYADEGFKLLPLISKGYVRGYVDALWSKYWKNVQWVCAYKGKLYTKFQDMPKDGQDFHLGLGRCMGFHVYKSNPQKHYTGEEENYKVGMIVGTETK